MLMTAAAQHRETRLTYEAGSNGLNVSQEQIVGMPSGVSVTRTTTYDNLGRKISETLKRRSSPTSATLIDLTTCSERPNEAVQKPQIQPQAGAGLR